MRVEAINISIILNKNFNLHVTTEIDYKNILTLDEEYTNSPQQNLIVP